MSLASPVPSTTGDGMKVLKYVESEAESTTTLTSPQEKIKATFTPNAAGEHLIKWQYERDNTSVPENVAVHVQVDDGADIVTDMRESYYNHDYELGSGFRRVNLTVASHDVDIDFNRVSGGTAKIRRARITVFEKAD